MTTQSTIEIQPLAAEHRQGVLNLIMGSFFTQEPLNAALKFDIPREPLSWVERTFDDGLRDDCSFVAVDTASPHKNVVGVILNAISNRNAKEETLVIPSEKLTFIFSLIDKVSKGHDLYELYQTDRLFHCDIINIDESQRGQNLSARLIDTSLDKARQMGVKGAVVVCSSLFSRKAFIRQGFEVRNEILYSEHGNGRLTDMGVHDRCSLLARKL